MSVHGSFEKTKSSPDTGELPAVFLLFFNLADGIGGDGVQPVGGRWDGGIRLFISVG